MLTARNVLTATLLIAALTLVVIGISLWQSMQPSPLGGDSFGTRAHGQRGAFELLSELQVPVERSLLPPDDSSNRSTTLVIWGPHDAMVQLEPVYLKQVAKWVNAGGRLVIALPRTGVDEIFSAARNPRASEHETSILEELGLPDVRVETVDLDDPNADSKDADPKDAGVKDSDPKDPDSKNAEQAEDKSEDEQEISMIPSASRQAHSQDFELFRARDSKTETAQVFCGGELHDWADVVARIEVPQRQLQVIETSAAAAAPAGWLKIKAADGSEQTLVASYRSGEGQILLVGDTELLENRLLGQADNSLLAWRLLVAPDRPVVWNEFYHGLTIRGNPLYLLRREPFGALMAALLMLIAVCIWRQAVRFGPASAAPPTSRRTLAEYVETMARLFQRGRRSQPFLLAEVRSGMLWMLRCDLGLNLGQEKPETIIAVLRRKRPEQAARLSAAVQAIDQTLASGQDLSERETILTLQRISDCL